MSKKTIMSIFLILSAFILVFGLFEKYKPAIERIKSTITLSDVEFAGVKEESMASVYSDIHHMSHNVVIADDKWGYKDLTLDNIDMLIMKVSTIEAPEEAKKEVLKILTSWKNGDFSRVNYDHNYVWNKLGGTVGRATGVNTRELPDWAVE